MPISIQQEALESCLESLLTYKEENPEGLVCALCYGILAERTCDCTHPLWWPVDFVIRRIEGRKANS